MTTTYVLTFDAQWLGGLRGPSRVIRGEQTYTLTIPCGELDMASAFAICQVAAANEGTILFPESGVQVRTLAQNIDGLVPMLELDGVRVY